MAEVVSGKKKKKVSDNSPIIRCCKEFGVPFSCEEGTCGICAVDIVSGEENLSDLTDQEKDLDMSKKHRLACQCKIKSGKVEIKF